MLMRLDSINFYPVTNIDDHYRRQYDINIDGATLDIVGNSIAEFGSEAFDKADVRSAFNFSAGYSTNTSQMEAPIINLSDNNHTLSAMNRGSRFWRFVATITIDPIDTHRSSETATIITGYTSEADSTLSGLLPDDMRLYINEVIGIKMVYGYNSFGQRFVTKTTLTSDYAVTAAITAQFGTSPEQLVIPSTLLNAAHTSGQIGGYEKDTMMSAFFNPRATLVDSNSIVPEKFMRSAAQAYTLGLAETYNFNGNNSHNSLGQFLSVEPTANETLMSAKVHMQTGQNNFVRALRNNLSSKIEGNSAENLTNKMCFSLRELRTCLANGMLMDESIRASVNASRNMDFSYESYGWQSGTPGAAVAYDIANRIPSILLKCLVGSAAIVYDNTQVNYGIGSVMEAKMSITPGSIITPTGVIPDELSRLLEILLKQEIFSIVTRNGDIELQATIHASVGGVTRISVAAQGYPEETYVYASFMSSRLKPSLSSSIEYTGKLAETFNEFTGHLTSAYSEHSAGRAKTNIFDAQDYIPTSAPATNSFDFGGGTTPSPTEPKYKF